MRICAAQILRVLALLRRDGVTRKEAATAGLGRVPEGEGWKESTPVLYLRWGPTKPLSGVALPTVAQASQSSQASCEILAPNQRDHENFDWLACLGK